jgi:hypothetical protein
MTTVICIDTEYDARYTDLGVARLACMTYSFGPDQPAAIVGPAKAVDLWLGWVNDPSVIFLGHSLYHDIAVLAQESYFRTEKEHCIPGQGWAWEQAHRLYDPVFNPSFPGDELRASLRVVDTEIRQRLTQVRFGPHKASVRLGDLAKMLFGEDRSDAKDVPDEAQALLRAAVPYSDWPDDVLAKTPWRVLFGYLLETHGENPSDWPQDAVDYALDDARLPWRVLEWQRKRWGSSRIPDDTRQTIASWGLHVLSIPGWKADRPRAQAIRERYRTVIGHCDRTLIDAGILHVPGAVETAKRARLQALIFDAFAGDPPITKAKRDVAFIDEGAKREATATDTKTVMSAVRKTGAQVLTRDHVLHHAGGSVSQILQDSGAPALNAHLLRNEAKAAATKLLKTNGLTSEQAPLAPPEYAQLVALADACLPTLAAAGLVEVSYPRTIKKREVADRVFAELGKEAPLSKKKAEEFPYPTIEQRREFCSTDAKTVRAAVIESGGKLRLPADAVAKADEGAEAFDAWLADSGAAELNAYAVRTKADKTITNFLDRLDTDHFIRTSYVTLVDTGRTACVAAWTLIKTRQGLVPVEHIRVGDDVWTHRARWRRVTAVWRKGVQPMVAVHLSNGHVLTCTTDHRVLLSSGDWCRVGALSNDTISSLDREQGKSNKGVDHVSSTQVAACGHRRAAEHDRTERDICYTAAYVVGRTQSAKGHPAGRIEDGREKSNAWKDARETPSVGRRVPNRHRLSDSLAQRQTPISSSRSHGTSAGAGGSTGGATRTPYRWGRYEQQTGQFGAHDEPRASGYPCLAATEFDATHIEKIEAAGNFEVYDITVEADASYEACGIYHHNSRQINIQQFPRDYDKPGHLHVRGCIVPPPGECFLVADYSQLELCSLAHVLNVLVRHYARTKQRGFVENMLGREISDTYESTLAAAINANQDCHVRMAANLRGRGESYAECYSLYSWADAKKSKEFYAALGVSKSATFDEIETAYRSKIEPEAKVIHAYEVLRDVELRTRYDAPLTYEELLIIDHRQLAKPANFGFMGLLGPTKFVDYAAGYGVTVDIATARMAKRAYENTWIEMKLYFWHILQMCKDGVATVTQLYSKRQRGDCFPTQAANGYPQGLAVDGAKEALRRIIRAAYRVPSSPLFGTRPSGFVHDEFLVNCKIDQAPRALPALEHEMVEGMRSWIPDVKIKAPGKILYERWGK